MKIAVDLEEFWGSGSIEIDYDNPGVARAACRAAAIRLRKQLAKIAPSSLTTAPRSWSGLFAIALKPETCLGEPQEVLSTWPMGVDTADVACWDPCPAGCAGAKHRERSEPAPFVGVVKGLLGGGFRETNKFQRPQPQTGKKWDSDLHDPPGVLPGRHLPRRPPPTCGCCARGWR